MLNIAFLDAIGWNYDASTPAERPLGGSQSALAYLVAELARRGNRVTHFAGTAPPHESLGVSCFPTLNIEGDTLAQSFDAFVVLNGPAEIALQLRPHLDGATPLVLWTQHATDQIAMHALKRPDVRGAWDAFVCVSEWHRTTMIDCYQLDRLRVISLRNAIAPSFEDLFSSREELARVKSVDPVLCYTSTPFRGLNHLVDLFPQVRSAFPEVELQVYSSMKVYQQGESGDPYAPLYERCRTTPGIRYVGGLPQARLAEALRSASVLAYPNTFAETSCIAVMEAMAAGLFVVTTDLGALPETTMGYGALVASADGPTGPELDVRGYLDRLKGTLRRRGTDPAGFAAARYEQVEAIHATCTWRKRAPEWEDALRRWKHHRATELRSGA